MKRHFAAFVCALVCASSSFGETAVQADAFVDSVGVNTHLTYSNTQYGYFWPQTLAALQTLGVRHIRDGYWNWGTTNPYYAKHQALAKLGIRCNFVVQYDPTVTAENLKQFVPLAGDVESFENPNEMDDNGGASWLAHLQKMLPVVSAGGKSTGTPVLGPALVKSQSYAMLGDISPYISYNNIHVYFGGRYPGIWGWGNGDKEGHSYGSIAWWQDSANQASHGKTAIITETGYFSTPTTSKPYTVPENIEAIYAPRTILETWNHGVKRTYYYELIEIPTSTETYGLIRRDMSLKPAYVAVSNLLNMLADRGKSFSPGSLNYSVTGQTTNVHHLLMQKRDGSFWLALWIEASSYDTVHNVSTPVPSQAVTLNITDRPRAQTSYQWSDAGTVSTSRIGAKSQATLNLTDKITLVHIY